MGPKLRLPAWMALAVALAILASPAGAAFTKDNVKVATLDNGLKILLVEDHTIPNVALYTFFRVGSRNERPGLTGVSHFIEHMMFNGTQKYGPGQFDRTMEFRGGSNNAYTGNDLTAYTDWFPSAALEHMIGMEADRMQGLTFVPEVFESERGVIASERRTSTDNNNEAILSENVQATAIMAHPYHWDVIGWMSDILSWRRDEVMQYYRTYYAPNNAVLILVGDFDPAAALELLRKYYAAIPAATPPPMVTTQEPPQMGRKDVVVRKPAQTPSFMAVWHAAAVREADFFPLSVLAKPLLEGDSSRLHRRLVREEQLALQVGGGVQETIDPYLFQVYVKPRPGVDLNRIDAIVEEELEKIRTGGITPAELQKALNMVRSEFYRGLQTIAGKANSLGQAELVYGSYEDLFTVMDRYGKVTTDLVRDAAKRYFVDANKTVGKLIPEGGAK